MPIITTVTYTDQTASKVARINLRITAGGDKSLYPHENNQYALGLTSRKWSEVHGVTYYYGSSDTEFSDKFVTTDTAQTISGNKTFSSINGLEPSALGMPDLNNGIDISSYLTNIGTSTPSEYTPSVNGWIVLKIYAQSGSVVIRVSSDNGIDNYSYSERSDTGGLVSEGGYNYEKFASCIVPCIKNDKLNIYIMPTTASIVSAKFYPCQGNV